MAPIYVLALHKTYYDKGFLNLGVDVDRHVRRDSGPIVLLLGQAKVRVDARVHRDANQNGTPRVHAGVALRDWFQRNFALKDKVEVHITSPHELWLRKP